MADEFEYFRCIPLTTVDTSTLGASYTALNGSGFEDDIKILKIISLATQGITISYDGVEDHDFYPAGASFLLDLQTNHSNNSAYSSGTYRGRKGQIIYGKGAGNTGNLYIIGYK